MGMTREEAIKWLEYSKDHYEGMDYGAPRIAVDTAQAALREQPRWISVEERLPEDKCECLVYVKTHNKFSGYMTISWFYPRYDGSAPDLKGRKVWTGYDSEWGVFELRNVTHWMPLPEPPEVEV